MTEFLKGKCAVVTGSGQGFGRGIARELAKEGASVITNSRRAGTEGGDAKTTAEAIREAGGRAVPIFSDVSRPDEAKNLIDACVKEFGRIDILVNNAGISGDFGVPGDIADVPYDLVRKVHEVNFWGSLYCLQEACKRMKQQKSGRVVNVISRTFQGRGGAIPYTTSKGAIVSLTWSAAFDMAPYNVTVNAVAPAVNSRLVAGPEVKAIYADLLKAGKITQELHDLMMNMPEPEQAAGIVAYLCSDSAQYISGKLFFTTGGQVVLLSHPMELKGIYRDIEKDGPITCEQLVKLVPLTFGKDAQSIGSLYSY